MNTKTNIETAVIKQQKKILGQYMTPPDIAQLMANEIGIDQTKEEIKILEPSAGEGILIRKLVDSILAKKLKPKFIKIIIYELDKKFLDTLRRLAKEIHATALKSNVIIKTSVRHRDFLLEENNEKFDIIISNPPFFKIRKNDPRALAHSESIHGQPNIYGLFISACAKKLNDNGRYCLISPRSWASGPYFSKVREVFFECATIDKVLIFSNRRKTFKSEKIQQEMMITWSKKKIDSANTTSILTPNNENDLLEITSSGIPISQIFPDQLKPDSTLLTKQKSLDISLFENTISSLKLKASTGRVVPFRCEPFLSSISAPNVSPLIWMKHLQKNEINWPLKVANEFIENSLNTKRLLLPSGNYVLVRRFSPREHNSRITAAALYREFFDGHIGIENHINYIHSIDKSMSKTLAAGLTAYLNSDHVSIYLNKYLGNTQVNARDLNSLPCPNNEELKLLAGLKQHKYDELVTKEIEKFIFQRMSQLNRRDIDAKRTSERAAV